MDRQTSPSLALYYVEVLVVATMKGTNFCQTCYPSRKHLSFGTCISLIVANVLIAGANILLNAFLMYGLIKTKQLRKLSSKFIVCLSVSDCCVGLLLQPLVTVLLIFYSQEQHCYIELAAQIVGFLFAQFSGGQIVIIAMDRFFQMKFLRKHRAYMTKKRGKMLIVFNACLSIGLAAGSFVASTNEKFYQFNFVFAVLDLILLSLTFVFYGFTYYSVHGHVRQAMKKDKERQKNLSTISSSSTKTLTRSVSTHSRLKSESALTRTMIFILATLSICYFPYLLLGIMWSYFRYEKEDSSKTTLAILTWWSFMLIHLNSSVNALLFASRNEKIMVLFRKITCNKQEQDTSANGTEMSMSRDLSTTF